MIDVDMAALLLKSDRMRHMKNDSGESIFGAHCRTLHLGIHLGGYIPVSYRVPKSGFGRYISRVSIVDGGDTFMPMLSTMKREVRGLLADKYYLDVDFVNCHPVILEQLLYSHRIPCPLLQHYINNRELCLAEVEKGCGVSRDCAKELFIRMSYLGSIKEWIVDASIAIAPASWVTALGEELSGNAVRILHRPELDGIRLLKTRDLRAGAVIPTRVVSSIISIYLQKGGV